MFPCHGLVMIMESGTVLVWPEAATASELRRAATASGEEFMDIDFRRCVAVSET